MDRLQIRILDVLFSLVGITLALPFMVVILVYGYFENGSPLYFQTRVGKNQKPFTLVKFRTMVSQTEPVGTHLVDPIAITKLGRFLRKTKLDELPQLFNVLLGQMSLVGPRPCLPNQTELINERKKRHVFNVRPGVTGLAQVNRVNMSTPRKLARYDKIMAINLCAKLYARVILATALGKGHGEPVTTPR